MTRKLKSALFSTLMLSGLFFLSGVIEGSVGAFSIVVLFYAGVGNFLYGIPVSFLSDYLTRKLLKFRFMVAGFIHLLFGTLTTFVIGGLGIFAVVCSLLFFLFEELQRKNRLQFKVNRKTIFINGIITISLFSLGIYGLWHSMGTNSEKETNQIYLIPSGYKGSIVVYYDVSKEPPLKKEGKFSVIPVKVENLEALADTDIEQYGITLTSTPMNEDGGTINDKYYYVDETGKRTEIDQYCISNGSSGSFSADNEKEIQYTTLQITKTDCSEEFFLNGKDIYHTQMDEVHDYWRNNLLAEN
ncbi:hypothetical protein PH210_23120 [Paenibacillus sp. BSR1-1]|uniref:DUF6843 domain-containing protein n=1 Tax=Paenibacillus sp. BSR1-1 TaxID=3020845 RepID=UPI0025B13DBE|nr:hypothetical protein [Paenibacillus sp. BSR1-1]MDN3019068.1 hypothetical protein [Paenibacillus sp. BSR1-1]